MTIDLKLHARHREHTQKLETLKGEIKNLTSSANQNVFAAMDTLGRTLLRRHIGEATDDDVTRARHAFAAAEERENDLKLIAVLLPNFTSSLTEEVRAQNEAANRERRQKALEEFEAAWADFDQNYKKYSSDEKGFKATVDAVFKKASDSGMVEDFRRRLKGISGRHRADWLLRSY